MYQETLYWNETVVAHIADAADESGIIGGGPKLHTTDFPRRMGELKRRIAEGRLR